MDIVSILAAAEAELRSERILPKLARKVSPKCQEIAATCADAMALVRRQMETGRQLADALVIAHNQLRVEPREDARWSICDALWCIGKAIDPTSAERCKGVMG